MSALFQDEFIFKITSGAFVKKIFIYFYKFKKNSNTKY